MSMTFIPPRDNGVEALLLFIWLMLTFNVNASEICLKNQSEVSWLVPAAEQVDNDHSNYVGKKWRIDCRFNGSGTDVILLQGKTQHPPWQKRHPDGRILIQKQQVFTFLSLNDSDIGYYYCKLCNKTKFVGRLSNDISNQIPIVYPTVQFPISPGGKATYACNVKGVYVMFWVKVALNGSRTLIKSNEESLWKSGYRFTSRRFTIDHFTADDEALYMCSICRPSDDYTAEKEIYLRLQRHKLPIHWYYTTFSKKEIGGHLMRFLLHVYSCHLPIIASLQVFEPIKGIYWTRNFTADQSKALKLDKNSNYSMKLEMHIHPEGHYKDHLHVTASIVNLVSYQTWDVIDQKFKMTGTKCDREKCRWSELNTFECPRYLDNLDEKLNATFILTLRDPCAKIFHLQIRDSSGSNNNSLLDMDFENNTQARMQLEGFKNQKISTNIQGRVHFAQWYLTLIVEDNSTNGNMHKVKLVLDMPDNGLRGKFPIMEGEYTIIDSGCRTQGQSSEGKTKTIALYALVIILLFVACLLVFVAVWMYRRYRNRSGNEFLLTSMEDEAL